MAKKIFESTRGRHTVRYVVSADFEEDCPSEVQEIIKKYANLHLLNNYFLKEGLIPKVDHAAMSLKFHTQQREELRQFWKSQKRKP